MDTLQAGLEAGMAQKVTVALEDDLTGGPADETVRFALEGTDYEIDLSAKNAATFHKQLAFYVQHARKAGRAQPRQSARTAANRQRSGDIRAWAKEHGLVVSERGRIPAGVVAAVPRGRRRPLKRAIVLRGAKTHALHGHDPTIVRPAGFCLPTAADGADPLSKYLLMPTANERAISRANVGESWATPTDTERPFQQLKCLVGLLEPRPATPGM